PGDAFKTGGSWLNVGCNGPKSPSRVEPFSPCGPTNRPWLGFQEGTDSIDFALGHCLSVLMIPRGATASENRHPERREAESKDPAAPPKRNPTGFDSLTSRSLSLRPFRPCRGLPAVPFSTSLGMTETI